MSEHVDGVAGRQVGAGDKVLPGGRLHLHPGPALQVAVEAAHLAGRERDVGHTALAAVPGWIDADREEKIATVEAESLQSFLSSDCVSRKLISANTWLHSLWCFRREKAESNNVPAARSLPSKSIRHLRGPMCKKILLLYFILQLSTYDYVNKSAHLQ